MSTYFPFFRGRQHELLALRALAPRIASSRSIYPIIEPVNSNSTTRISLDQFAEAGMPFVFITNPMFGDFVGNEDNLYAALTVDGTLDEYEDFVPALIVNRETSIIQVNKFNENYATVPFRAVIYLGEPANPAVQDWCGTEDRLYFHIIRDGTVSAGFVQNTPQARRVIIRDPFVRRERNSDYPPIEFFTDQNTTQGNPRGINWGDYSIQGDYFKDKGGGPAMTVALHHIHYSEDGESLSVSHYLSDRQETTEDTPGKVIEAVEKLVGDLESLAPNDTVACGEYQLMARSGNAKTLGYMKRLAILQHLETILNDE